jgi:hypothetical protein
MEMTEMYDKTGAAFRFDHEHDGMAYVRPLVKVFVQSGYDDDEREHEGYEPAGYLVAMDRSSLFDAPPLAVVNDEVVAKQVELEALKADAKKVVRDINSQRSAAERELQAAKHQLDSWMQSHRVMMDLGNLLDGKVLYPLSVRENGYHHAREIPRIPEMRNSAYLAIHSGNFEKGQKWVARQHGIDTYGSPFCFFDTEEERASVILYEFEATCHKFRENPNFDTTSYTSSTRLHYGTLLEWVKTHPSLSIPEDIKASKAVDDAALVEQRKAALAAELAAIEAKTEPNAA